MPRRRASLRGHEKAVSELPVPLLIFFLLFGHFRVSASPLVVVAMSTGSLMNPLGFLALAIKPTLRQQPTSPFGIVMLVSFTMTTIGYGGAAWSVGHAALSRMTTPPGQLVDVGGRRLHLECSGTGSPTVVLESGLGESGAYWGWIATAVAHDTSVCVHDRAGRGLPTKARPEHR